MILCSLLNKSTVAANLCRFLFVLPFYVYLYFDYVMILCFLLNKSTIAANRCRFFFVLFYLYKFCLCFCCCCFFFCIIVWSLTISISVGYKDIGTPNNRLNSQPMNVHIQRQGVDL